MARACSIIVLLASTAASVAQEPSVKLKIPTRALEVGEAVEVQLVCTNTPKPGQPQGAVPEGLELNLTSAAPSRVSSTTIINGRMTQSTTYTYRMRLIARKEGTYTLGPISVVAGGKTYKTSPLRIVVSEPGTFSTPRGDQFIWVDMDVEPRSLYVTQSLTATLEIGIRKVRLGGRTIPMNLFRSVLDQRGSRFSIFAGAGVKQTQRSTWLADSTGTRHQYEILRLVKQIRTERPGPMPIGPIFAKANYPTAVGRGLWGGYDVRDSRKETARAEAITVEVKRPPDQGRPADFSGAIGKYRMQVTAKPTRVEQGQPVTLTITIRGNPLEGIAGPDLAKQPELSSRYDYIKDELVGDLESGRKVFRRAVFPRQQGEQTIGPISWSYFDPALERYVTRTSEPVTITVDPPSGGEAPIVLAGETASASGDTILTLLTGGMSPNYIDADSVLMSQTLAITPPWATSLVAPPLLCLMVTLTARRRIRLRADPGLTRRRRAGRNARAQIARALRSEDEGQKLQRLSEALTGYIADRFNLPPGTLTPPEVRALLNDPGRFAVTESIVAFLEECDTHRWIGRARGTNVPGDSPIEVQSTNQRSPQMAAAEIRLWIKQIEIATR